MKAKPLDEIVRDVIEEAALYKASTADLDKALSLLQRRLKQYSPTVGARTPLRALNVGESRYLVYVRGRLLIGEQFRSRRDVPVLKAGIKERIAAANSVGALLEELWRRLREHRDSVARARARMEADMEFAADLDSALKEIFSKTPPTAQERPSTNPNWRRVDE